MKTITRTALAWLIFLAAGPAVAQEEHPDVEVRNLADGVWIHTTYRTYDNGLVFPSHGLIVREGDELTLIDTAWGAQETELLLDAIAVQIGLPVTRAIVTHFHGDRAGGVDVIEALGVDVWAHPMTKQLTIDNEWPVPHLALEGLEEPGDAVEFGGLEVFYPGPAHTRDNIMVWLPAQEILFGGCAIRGADDREIGNRRDADIAHWPTAMKLTEERYGQARMVVSSHAEPAGPELFGHTASLARQAGNNRGSE